MLVGSIPTSVQKASMLMKADLTASELEYTQRVLNRAPWNRWSGQNRMMGLGIRMNLGVILGNETIVQDAFTNIWVFLTIQTGE